MDDPKYFVMWNDAGTWMVEPFLELEAAESFYDRLVWNWTETFLVGIRRSSLPKT